MFKFIAAAIIWTLMVSLGVAQQPITLEKGVRSCSEIEDSVKRLTCFDVLTKPYVEQANAAASTDIPADKGLWSASVQTSAIDDSRSIFLSVKAKAGYADDYATRHPSLWLRCLENSTSVYVDFDEDYMSDLGARGEVTTRIDDQTAKEVRWEVSTDNAALGFWSGGAAIPFIKSMIGADKLLVRAIPVSANPVTIEFPISGLEAAIGPLRESCGW